MTLSYAQSLDGSIAINRDTSYSISGSESRLLTHQLRAAHDAILVGIGTVLADNPHLTVRLVDSPSPIPIILDSHLRLPLNSNLLQNTQLPLIVATTPADQKKQQRLEGLGAKIIHTPPDERGWVDLHSLLLQLADLGIKNVMVEGGARVITSFLSRHLVDWIVITIAPMFLGGLHAVENPLISGNENDSHLNDQPEFKKARYEQLGRDMIFWSELSWANR